MLEAAVVDVLVGDVVGSASVVGSTVTVLVSAVVSGS